MISLRYKKRGEGEEAAIALLLEPGPFLFWESHGLEQNLRYCTGDRTCENTLKCLSLFVVLHSVLFSSFCLPAPKHPETLKEKLLLLLQLTVGF